MLSSTLIMDIFQGFPLGLLAEQTHTNVTNQEENENMIIILVMMIMMMMMMMLTTVVVVVMRNK